jgi:hypothetical protein
VGELVRRGQNPQQEHLQNGVDEVDWHAAVRAIVRGIMRFTPISSVPRYKPTWH